MPHPVAQSGLLTATLRHITWRGPLALCNYTCSYCPFAGKTSNTSTNAPLPGAKLQKDEIALSRFTAFLQDAKFHHPLSILLSPYGEGLIHSHYRKGMSAISRLPRIAALACQTNLSMEPYALLRDFEREKADFSRLALWASFHPEMTSAEEFSAKIHALAPHIKISAGVVGNPEHAGQIARLRALLPQGVTFWINAMDGLKRPYTPLEAEAFTALDPLFPQELCRRKGDFAHCSAGRASIFMRGNGVIYPCNRSRLRLGKLYGENGGPEAGRVLNASYPGHKKIDNKWSEHIEAAPDMGECQGNCDCFLAYAARKDVPQLLRLAPYPFLRLATTGASNKRLTANQGKSATIWRQGCADKSLPSVSPAQCSEGVPIKALFLDLDGTLTGADGIIRPSVKKLLPALAARLRIYPATALPLEYARQKFGSTWSCISGGVFAYGADLRDFTLPAAELTPLPSLQPSLQIDTLRSYAHQGEIYKQILRHMPDSTPEGCRVIAEQGVISLCAEAADKLSGVLRVASWRHWADGQILVMGDAEPDLPMLEHFPLSAAPPTACFSALRAARFHITAEELFEILLDSAAPEFIFQR